MPVAADPTNPLLMDPDLLERMQRIADDADREQDRIARRRRKRPLVRLWDGDMVYRGRVTNEYEGHFQWRMNNTGSARLLLPVGHYLTNWAIDPWGRTKQNVHLTFDKDGARWGGRCAGDASTRITVGKDGKRYVELNFLDDYEELKNLLVWCSPYLPSIIQKRAFVLAGPSRYMLKLALFLNIMRLEGNWFSLPDDPMDLAQWGQAFNMSNWNMVVNPHSLLSDSSPWTVLSSRFEYWHDMAEGTLADAQLMVTTRRYLAGDPPPWPGANIRPGAIVFDVVDVSGYWDETSTGGTIWDGLVRTVVQLADNLVDEIVTTVTGSIDPYQNIVGKWVGTLPRQPYVVYRDGQISGIDAFDWSFTPGTVVQVVAGGHSAPGINELMSNGIVLGGNYLGQLIGLPTAGVIADTFLKPIYTDTVGAWWTIKSPVRALRYGWSHYQEGRSDSAKRAYTLSSLMDLRDTFHKTRPRTTHAATLGDGRPYRIGDQGQGHWWLGSRIGVTNKDFPRKGVVFVEQASQVDYDYDRDSRGWSAITGDPRVNEAPGEKNIRLLRSALVAGQQLGVI
ncbi:phage tail protein [Rhodococcoides fascians]|uniref:Gp37-like protein n=1 Tax=Rhodococcoides fascians TaxID=1828 RepID=UPI000B9C1219|nr:phage tail protein [Rhodococcus fascians]OZE89984.1 phage tail protein [Rhodococcus fascians]OZF18291.1 phage tail protein [Rhodococcus fascians]OZF21742.1 phage tail protein [Rhodococcus fascians]OZF67367.1 phage tail protein [Rhodococcus fascians]OZF70557.1 phage tail protein [Rhodococcus fascians]